MKCKIGVTKLAVAGLLCVAAPVLRAQKTFDEYFKMVKQQQIGERQAAFMKECGVPAEDSLALYGVRLGAIDSERWSPRDLLGTGRAEGFEDYYTTEIRAIEGKPRFVNIWWITKSTGESQNAMYCFGVDAKVKTMLTLNIFDPPQGSGSTASRYLLQQELTSSGRTVQQHGMFINAEGAEVAAPKLSKQDLRAAQAPGATLMAYEAIRDLWGKQKGPMVVPYEQPQPARSDKKK